MRPELGSSSLVRRVLLASVALAGSLAAQQPSPVVVEAAEVRELQEARRVSGEVRAARRARIAAREPGLVAEMLVREGDLVEAGAPLARLDATLLETDVTILQAERARAAAELVEAEAAAEREQRNYAVLEQLAERDAVNPKELADARSQAAVVEARRARAEGEVAVIEARARQLERRIADMTPTAPFRGWVVARHAEAGAWVGVGGPVVELISAGELEAWLDVPQAYWTALAQASGPLVLDVDTGARIEAQSWRVVPALETAGRTFPLVVALPEGAGLAAGMSLSAEVPTGARAEHLTVARDAILRGETGPYVYVAQPGAEGGHAAALTPVDVVFYAGDRAAVRSPRLSRGDLVIVEGNERLFPTAPVAPRQRDAR